jgi:hypothetical protein
MKSCAVQILRSKLYHQIQVVIDESLVIMLVPERQHRQESHTTREADQLSKENGKRLASVDLIATLPLFVH